MRYMYGKVYYLSVLWEVSLYLPVELTHYFYNSHKISLQYGPERHISHSMSFKCVLCAPLLHYHHHYTILFCPFEFSPNMSSSLLCVHLVCITIMIEYCFVHLSFVLICLLIYSVWTSFVLPSVCPFEFSPSMPSNFILCASLLYYHHDRILFCQFGSICVIC